MKGQKTVTTLDNHVRQCQFTLLKNDHIVANIHFCNWFLQSAPTIEVDPQLAFSVIRPDFPYMER